jgi:hypothetical protein
VFSLRRRFGDPIPAILEWYSNITIPVALR